LCLGIEAMNRSTANSISLPENLCPTSWHASALLIGRNEHSPRAKPFVSGALAEVCRKLCSCRNPLAKSIR
jgi:hypothetical protein